MKRDCETGLWYDLCILGSIILQIPVHVLVTFIHYAGISWSGVKFFGNQKFFLKFEHSGLWDTEINNSFRFKHQEKLPHPSYVEQTR